MWIIVENQPSKLSNFVDFKSLQNIGRRSQYNHYKEKQAIYKLLRTISRMDTSMW